MGCPFSRFGTAVIGRTESTLRLAVHEATPASNSAFVSTKNICTSSSSVWWSRCDTNWANKHQCPGGNSELGPSDQYSEIIFCSSVKCAEISTNSRAWRSNSSVPCRSRGNRLMTSAMSLVISTGKCHYLKPVRTDKKWIKLPNRHIFVIERLKPVGIADFTGVDR